MTVDVERDCRAMAERARAASRVLGELPGRPKVDCLRRAAEGMRVGSDALLRANALDVAAAPSFGLTDAQVDRLRLDTSRIESMASAIEQVAGLSDPVGEVIESRVRPNGLRVSRVRVPLGVVFFIYESRPNVTADAAAICIQSGNAVILRGGKEAVHSNRAIVAVWREAARASHIPEDSVQLVPTADREAVGHFLRMPEWIDVAIPRGGEALIRRVAEEARMPVIKHFAGNCHVYVDASADFGQAVDIVVNSKCQRMGVCNACESLLVHEAVADAFLPAVAQALAKYAVELRGDGATRARVPEANEATDADYAAEYLGPVLSIRVVRDLDEAIDHINRFGTGHTDAIVTREIEAAERFARRVDSAAVVVNASTRFHDGGELGLGAEIGISTDKFHARGPCGLRELTTYKYVVLGNGQIRT